MRNRWSRLGFTLIELLVVIAIIAILAAVLFPVFMQAKEQARKARCASNMKQLNGAILMYVDDSGGRFPEARSPRKADGGIYYSHIHHIVQHPELPPREWGPYLQDLIGPYVKNAAVWACPSIGPNMKIADYEDQGYDRLTWSQNTGYPRSPTGGPPVPSKVWTNYMWIHVAKSVDQTKWKRISGSFVSEVIRSTRAVTLMEMPYWDEVAVPHKGNSCGINVAFYDGHVQLERNPIHAYLNLSWQGWNLQ